MHICRNASRTFYFKRMQGKSRFENSKRLFILPTLWGFFTDAQTIFFSFNHMEVLQIFSSHFYHRLETLFFVHSFLYSTDSSWALSMRLRHGARNKVARHLGGWDYMLWILTTHLTSCLSSVAHSKGSQRRKWQPTPVCLQGESHGHRSVAGEPMTLQRVRHDWAAENKCKGTQSRHPHRLATHYIVCKTVEMIASFVS